MPTVAVVGGDGIGPEVISVAVELLESIDADLEFDHLTEVSAERFLATGTTLTDDEFSRLRDCDAILFGAVGDPKVGNPDYARGVILRLRSELDLYVNIRPAVLMCERLTPLRNCGQVDLIIVRENTEGLYSGLGGTLRSETVAEMAMDVDISTFHGVSRVIEYAFQIARSEVCMVDKSNAVKFGGGTWQRVWRELASRYPHLATRHLFVDTAAMKLVENLDSFDVLVTNNSYGDILSDLAAALIGGLGLASSGNINPEAKRGLFEPVHGSAPDLAGRQLANPVGAILSAAMLLDFLKYPGIAEAVRNAVQRAVISRACTPDIGGQLSTREAGRAVMAELNRIVG